MQFSISAFPKKRGVGIRLKDGGLYEGVGVRESETGGGKRDRGH